MPEHISFQQLVDLSFNSPVDGNLNVEYLYALMHGLVHKMDLGNISIEMKGGAFSKLEETIENLKPTIEVNEYEARVNNCTGKICKKHKIMKSCVKVDKVLVLKDINAVEKCVKPNCRKYDSDDTEKCKPRCNNDLNEDTKNCVENCLENVFKNLGRPCTRSTNESSTIPPCTIQSFSTTSDEEDVCNIDCNLFACIQELTDEVTQIKCELRKTQTVLTKINEQFSIFAATSEETDMKFEEIMNLFDDYDKRVSNNSEDILVCQKEIEKNAQQIETANEEIKTLCYVKANKDETDHHLSKKADITHMELKVDIVTFDNIKKELSEAILDSHFRLKVLSNEVDARVKQICQCLTTKTDRETFSAFAKCIEDRIKAIACTTKKWMNIKKKEVCPYTTTPFIQNMCCGACNQPVVMQGMEGNVPLMPSLGQNKWSCYMKNLKCQQPDTPTTNQKRPSKQTKFAEASDCLTGLNDLDFPYSCYDSLQPKVTQCIPNEE